MITFDKVIAKHIRYMPILKINAQKPNNVNVGISMKRHQIAIKRHTFTFIFDFRSKTVFNHCNFNLQHIFLINKILSFKRKKCN